jgi:hypothetical protein
MVREGMLKRNEAGQGQVETVQTNSNHGKMISPTNQGANMDTTTLLSLPLEVLQEVVVKVLSGELKVKDGVLVAPLPAGPRGPTAKVAPRLEACNASFLSLAGRPEGVTAKELLESSNGQFLYTDILLVARNLMEAGTIQEVRKGRKATWNLTTSG